MLVSPLVADAFRDLGISVSTWTLGVWRSIHIVPNVTVFEVEHGAQPLRHLHNVRALERVLRTRQIAVAVHQGFHDLFVPIVTAGDITTVLVAGPFATEYPSSTDVLDRWRALTRSRGRLTNPEFSRYLSATLSTLTLTGALFDAFRRLMSCFARLVSGKEDVPALAGDAEGLRRELLAARRCERMWATARSIVDERMTYAWSTPLQTDPLADVGLIRAPKHAMVGLLDSQSRDADPLDEMLRRAAFQRASVALAGKQGSVVCGQVGDRGITLLADVSGSASRVRTALIDLATRASVAARRFGFRLHAGIARTDGSDSVAARYRSALAAAESALSRGVALIVAEARAEPSGQHLRQLRAELARGADGAPGTLSTRFDRYVEAVLVHAGYQIAGVRAHLEAGLERLAEPLLSSGILDLRSVDELCQMLESDREAQSSVVALVASYRRVISDLESAAESPAKAVRDRSTHRALEFIREHLADPLTLTRVARVAGFAPDHFSRLLKREQGASFDLYLQGLRLERAKHLLTSTSTTVHRIAELSGFRSRTSFQRLFKKATGVTPGAFQRRGALFTHRPRPRDIGGEGTAVPTRRG